MVFDQRLITTPLEMNCDVWQKVCSHTLILLGQSGFGLLHVLDDRVLGHKLATLVLVVSSGIIDETLFKVIPVRVKSRLGRVVLVEAERYHRVNNLTDLHVLDSFSIALPLYELHDSIHDLSCDEVEHVGLPLDQVQSIDVVDVPLTLIYLALYPVAVQVVEEMVDVLCRDCKAVPLFDVEAEKILSALLDCFVVEFGEVSTEVVGELLVQFFTKKVGSSMSRPWVGIPIRVGLLRGAEVVDAAK